MKLHRVKALVIRHLYLYQRSIPRIMDLIYWPVMELIVWGFIAVFIQQTGNSGFNAIAFLLGAIVFWDILNQSQKAISIAFLEDVWERNLLNIFVAPVKLSELVASTVILAVIRIILVGIIMGLLGFLFYHFNIFAFGLALIPFMLNLLIFGTSLGLFTTAIIFRFGSSAQILAWGIIMLIQPFSAVFYPVSVLPQALQYVAYMLPSTYVFEGMRSVIETGVVPGKMLVLSFAVNAIFFLLCTWFFFRMFEKVKMMGRLLKLD